MLIVIPHVERRYILEGFFFFIAMPMKTNILLQYFIFLLIFAMLGLRYHERSSLAVGSRGYSSPQCTGFSLWWLLWLQSMGSRTHGLS